MSVLKCKMCGGNVIYNEGESVGTCESCGTKQTISKINDERINNMIDRANHYRINNEYDKALKIYEDILLENSKDSEVYWNLLLCKYGIEYVEDSRTKKRIPTINRMQYESILDDDDYKKAIKLADSEQKALYEEEAKYIAKVQKGILDITKNEKPYDIFICYKETDEKGERTRDSVLANDLYYQLTNEGYKVFFAKITLEDKLGVAYEPYIFAALNSSKVMVVLGTKPEYFNAVWVKNEWSRYLTLIKNGEKKVLIPAYRDMDPYDLPSEFSHLQAQDMSKLGFMQDLIRGIKKIVNANDEDVKDTVVINNAGGGSANTFVKRGKLALEDEEYEKADSFFEEALNVDAECAEAYLGKFLCARKVQSLDKLCEEEIEGIKNVVECGDGDVTILYCLDDDEVENYNKHVEEQVSKYCIAGGLSEDEIRKMYSFDNEYKTQADYIKSCKESIVEDFINSENGKYLSRALSFAKGGVKKEIDKSFDGLMKAYDEVFEKEKEKDKIEISRRREEIYSLCERNDKEIDEISNEKLKKNKTKMKLMILGGIAAVAAVAAVAIFLVVTNFVIPQIKYNSAVKLYNEGRYKEAINIFYSIRNFSNSNEWVLKNCEVVRNVSNKSELMSVKFGDIEWYVLDRKSDRALLISTTTLEDKAYNNTRTNITWEDCSLRKYLNNDFLNKHFNEEEKNKIVLTDVINKNNSKYGTKGGNNTKDKIFLLSVDEVKNYFSSDEMRATGDWYWLRSPGDNQDNAADVRNDGSVNGNGRYVDNSSIGIRPALWVSY